MKMTILLLMAVTFNLSITYAYGNIKPKGKDAAINYSSGDVRDLNNSVDMQQTKITGTIADENGSPFPGVNVLVEGTTIGVNSDINGKYSLDISDKKAVLIFTFVGYTTQRVPVGERTTIDISMALDITSLDEVLVVGYGTAKKATITGSVASVSGAKLDLAKSANFTNTLVGRLPGLTAVTPSGYPGDDDAILRIRGNNTLNNNNPLIVIDGIANRNMTRLNSSEIESVIILKDASAAIYGAQAANGVILITTKRGSTGNLKVEVGFNQGFSAPTVIPDMTDSYLYATMMNEIDSYENHDARYSADDLQKFKDGSDPWGHPNTNWMKEVYKPFSLENNANISISGGTENVKYYVSIGTKYQDGMWKKTAAYYKQADFRSNIDAKVTKNITMSLDLAGRQEDRNSPYYIGSGEGVMEYVNRSKPTDVAWWFNGLPGVGVEGTYNPVVLVTDEPGWDKDRRYIMESNMKLNINIPWVTGLSVTGNASIDKNFRTDKLWEVPFYLYSWDQKTFDSGGLPLLNGAKEGVAQPALNQYTSNGQQITLNGLINYERRINEAHNIKILVGSESSVGESSNFSASRKYFISGAIPELFSGADLEKDNTGSSSKNARLNYFGRVNYGYLSKYLFEFVWRYDGSYIFPANKRWGFFPGFSAGWVLSEENFWNLASFNYFKIRGSWGQTGNDRINAFQYLSTYGFGSQTILYYFTGNQWVTNSNKVNKLLQEQQIPNLNVTWEVANQTDIGFDAQMMGGKLKLEGDYFYNLRTNILTKRNASIPNSTGLTLPPENIGEVVNQGFEFVVSYGDKSRNFGYNISLNAGYAKNKIKFWDETPGIPDYQQTTGHPMNSGLYYQAIGIFKDQAAIDGYPHWVGARPGDVIFKDVNDDGKIDGLDMVRDYRSDIPNFTGGMNIDLTFKNFYATFLLQGAFGKIFYKSVSPGDGGNFQMEDAVGRWTAENTDATVARAFNYDQDYWRQNSNTYWLQNADYVRLKNFEIGYNIPQSVNAKLGLNGIRIYIGGVNLFTWSPHVKNYDPEFTSSNAYPLAKVINLGGTITF